MIMAKDKPKGPGGRPSDFTEDLGDLICQGISECKSLVKVCNSNDKMPEPRTVYRWLRTHGKFCQNYRDAKEDQADYMADNMIELADDTTIEPAHKKIMVDTRKWAASKFNAKKYGDRQTTVHEGELTLTQLSENELQLKFNAAKAKMDEG